MGSGIRWMGKRKGRPDTKVFVVFRFNLIWMSKACLMITSVHETDYYGELKHPFSFYLILVNN